MHAQRSSSPEQVDAAVMALLLDARFDLWAVSEVEREIGSAAAAHDSVTRLQASGLVHVIEETFVRPTRAALYMDRLELP
jgi:hypothetical protein